MRRLVTFFLNGLGLNHFSRKECRSISSQAFASYYADTETVADVLAIPDLKIISIDKAKGEW